MGEDSQQQATRALLLRQLSFVSGMPELVLAQQVADVVEIETRASKLKERPRNSKDNPPHVTTSELQARKLPNIGATPVGSAPEPQLRPLISLESRLPTILEETELEEPDDDAAHRYFRCWPMVLGFRRIVWNWIRAQRRARLH